MEKFCWVLHHLRTWRGEGRDFVALLLSFLHALLERGCVEGKDEKRLCFCSIAQSSIMLLSPGMFSGNLGCVVDGRCVHTAQLVLFG